MFISCKAINIWLYFWRGIIWQSFKFHAIFYSLSCNSLRNSWFDFSMLNFPLQRVLSRFCLLVNPIIVFTGMLWGPTIAKCWITTRKDMYDHLCYRFRFEMFQHSSRFKRNNFVKKRKEHLYSTVMVVRHGCKAL